MSTYVKGGIINIFICLVFSVSSMTAQTIDITGVLVDSISKIELPYATLVLKSTSDSVVGNVISNDQGVFIFQNVPYQEGMYITSRYLGYRDQTICIILKNRTKLSLGNIYLIQQSTMIDEAVVTGSIDYIVKKFDRTVYTMDEGKTASARTILDLLRVLPGVVVDSDGKVRFKGSEATIYIDEQPLNFQYPNIEMVPVDKVEKIELIDGAMYSGGNGQNGIINIKFKRIRNDGLSGLFSLKASTISLESLDNSKGFLNINYKNKKFSFFINSSIENSFSYSNTDMKKNIEIPSSSTLQSINTASNSQRLSNFNNIGVIYWPSSNTKIYLSCGFYTRRYQSNLGSSFNETDATYQRPINTNVYKERSKSDQLYKGLNLSYWHTFDTLDSYIKIFGNFNKYSIQSSQYSDYQFTLINSIFYDSSYIYNNDRDFNNSELNLNILYNHSISKSTRWNVAYNIAVAFKDTTANKHYISSLLSLPRSQFDVNTNQRHNLSVRFGSEIKKWKIDGGINFIDYRIDGNFKRYKEDFQDTTIRLNKNYFKIQPSVTVAFELNKNADIKLTISQYSNLPNFNKLSDYVDKKDLFNWYSGNSELKAVDIYSLYLGYNFNLEDIHASAECFYNYTNNDVAEVSIPLTSQLVLTRPENVAQVSNVGLDLSTWLRLNKNFNCSISSTLFFLLYDNSNFNKSMEEHGINSQTITNKEFGINAKFNVEYKFNEYYTMFYLNYYSKRLTFDGFYSPWVNSSINASRKFWNKKLSVSIGINNIFDDILTHSSYSNSFRITSNSSTSSSQYKRLFVFSLQYTFKKGDRGTKNYRLGG